MASHNYDKSVLGSESSNLPQELDVLTYYGHLRAYVQHEDALINSRLTWSFTVHGALFAVYGVLWGKVAELFIRLNDTYPALTTTQAAVAHSSDPAISKVIFLLLLAQIPIAYLGMVVGWSSRSAIRAAHRAIQTLDEHAQKIAAIRQLPGVTRGGAHPDSTDSARQYYFLLPAGAVGVWVALLILSTTATFFALFNNPA